MRLAKTDLMGIEAEDILASRVFEEEVDGEPSPDGEAEDNGQDGADKKDVE